MHFVFLVEGLLTNRPDSSMIATWKREQVFVKWREAWQWFVSMAVNATDACAANRPTRSRRLMSKGAMRMNAKQYFENLRRIDKRIRDKQALYEHYQGLTARAARAETEQIAAAKLCALQSELETEIAELCEYRETAMSALRKLEDERLREVLELRYLRGYSWEMIAQDMRYDRSYVWRLSQRALEQASQWLPMGA